MRHLCYHESGILQHLFGGDRPVPSLVSDSSSTQQPQSKRIRKQMQQQQEVEKALDRLRQFRLQQHYQVLKQQHPELAAAAAEGLAAQRRRAHGVAAAADAGPGELYKAFFLKALAVPPNRWGIYVGRGVYWSSLSLGQESAYWWPGRAPNRWFWWLHLQSPAPSTIGVQSRRPLGPVSVADGLGLQQTIVVTRRHSVLSNTISTSLFCCDEVCRDEVCAVFPLAVCPAGSAPPV